MGFCIGAYARYDRFARRVSRKRRIDSDHLSGSLLQTHLSVSCEMHVNTLAFIYWSWQ
jgi:hypothetical protein